MSKIIKHKENILKFMLNKCCYGKLLNKNLIEEFIESELCYFAICLISVFNSQIKKNKIKTYHTLHISSTIILMTMVVYINENINSYISKYGKDEIDKLLLNSTLYIYETIKQNCYTVEQKLGEDVSNKIHKKISVLLHEKLLKIYSNFEPVNNTKIKKTDIITYNFKNETILDKYKVLERVDNDELLIHIQNKYGTIGECAFLFGWIFGFSEVNEEIIKQLETVGLSFGILIKIVTDFNNLETDINLANTFSYNYIVNHGIHNSFRLFDQYKIKFYECCFINDLYNPLVKEVIHKLEKAYDKCLFNSNLELNSHYSSYE